jgi:hypothetical protein
MAVNSGCTSACMVSLESLSPAYPEQVGEGDIRIEDSSD